MTDLADAVRELEKAHDVLQACNDYFQSQAMMNAALHMSDRVIPNPLASAVETEMRGLEVSIDGFQRVLNGEAPLPFPMEGNLSVVAPSTGDPITFGSE